MFVEVWLRRRLRATKEAFKDAFAHFVELELKTIYELVQTAEYDVSVVSIVKFRRKLTQTALG